MTIHWCGAGLSSGPGLRRLIGDGHPVVVWNRTLKEARALVGDIADDIRVFKPEKLQAALKKGDIVVSMMLAEHHPAIAGICVGTGAHFISSSYAVPEIAALDEAARDAGVVLLNEVGLDPGIDHLMAHDLVAAYRASPAYDVHNAISFTSYCGGLPKVAGAFRYKFSWSPLGVLKALNAPSRSIRFFTELAVRRPWNALTIYTAPLPQPETFEVYPNRDSLPYIATYRFDPAWPVREFSRGTLRLMGWAEAWAPIFGMLEGLTGKGDDKRLKTLADQLRRDHSFAPGEADRVVLCVSLKAERDGVAVWHRSWVLDAHGDVRGSAMARLVSGMVALAVEAVLAREVAVGVQSVPHDPRLVARWLGTIAPQAQHMRLVRHLG